MAMTVTRDELDDIGLKLQNAQRDLDDVRQTVTDIQQAQQRALERGPTDQMFEDWGQKVQRALRDVDRAEAAYAAVLAESNKLWNEYLKGD